MQGYIFFKLSNVIICYSQLYLYLLARLTFKLLSSLLLGWLCAGSVLDDETDQRTGFVVLPKKVTVYLGFTSLRQAGKPWPLSSNQPQ